MYQRTYRVKGEDVNDFMIMQNSAFLKYASQLLETFLFENGFTKKKLNAEKIGFDFKYDHLSNYKSLIFTNQFKINLLFKSLEKNNHKMNVDFHFYNDNNELVVKLERTLFWFDYETLKNILPPLKIQSYFKTNDFFKRAS